jgi:hypothetical protein
MVEELVDGQANATAERRAVANAEIGAALDDRELAGTEKPFSARVNICGIALL